MPCLFKYKEKIYNIDIRVQVELYNLFTKNYTLEQNVSSLKLKKGFANIMSSIIVMESDYDHKLITLLALHETQTLIRPI